VAAVLVRGWIPYQLLAVPQVVVAVAVIINTTEHVVDTAAVAAAVD
jgi:hypothetical protein